MLRERQFKAMCGKSTLHLINLPVSDMGIRKKTEKCVSLCHTSAGIFLEEILQARTNAKVWGFR